MTNTLKHAGNAETTVHIRYDDSAVEIEVVDRGHASGSAAQHRSGGVGLVGMRERVALIGGRLQAGPEPGAGFAVRAYLPLRGEAM